MSLSRDHRLSFKHLGVHDIRSILYCCLTKSQYFSGSRILADYTFFILSFLSTLLMEVHLYGVWRYTGMEYGVSWRMFGRSIE